MKLKAYIESTILGATKAMIGAIDNSDFNFNHVIVVPDRFSLQMEKLLLKTLPSQALFNVKVVGLSSLAVDILNQLGKKCDVLTNAECLLITQQAITAVKNQFLSFKKCGISFAHEAYKLIAQLKSSKIGVEDLNTKAQGLTGEKYHDIALIYEEYEKRLQGKLDANARLNLVTEEIESNDILGSTSFYFAQFDSFTKEGFDLIKALLPKAREVCVSISESLSIGNDYIYEKDILQKLSSLAKEKSCEVELIQNHKQLCPQQEAITRGVYSYEKIKADNNGFYFALTSSSIRGECLDVGKLIHYYITSGYSYKDMIVCCGEFEKYRDEIEDCFEKLDIPCYIDSSVSADNTILSRFIFSFFNVITGGYGKDALLSLLSNPLLDIDRDLIDKCQKYCVDNIYKYRKYIEKDFCLAHILKKLENLSNAKDFENLIKEICQIAAEGYQRLREELTQKSYLKEEKINEQALDIILQTLELISKYHSEISIDEYFKTLKLLLSFKEVSSVPAFCDAVMVGDGQEGYFDESKIVFVLGCQGLPVVNNDNGLLNDDDISLNFIDKKIEPTIRMINRRNRFKVFNLLTLASEKLIVSYQLLNEEGKAIEQPTFVENLNEIFGQRTVRFSRGIGELNSEKRASLLLRLGNRHNFRREYYKYLRDEDKSILKIKDENLNIDKSKIDNAKNTFFANNKLRVTELENYFSCPFKHFVSYGLALKEKEIYEFDVRDIGNICHAGVEMFVREQMRRADKQISVENFLDNNLKVIIKNLNLEEKLDAISEKEALLLYIRHQLEVILKDVATEISRSSFKPKLLEAKIENIKIGNEEIDLTGKADRVDEAGEYFRIIDYKTGATGNLLKELYYGTKLQLFLYQGIFGKLLGKKPAGVFYFNAKLEYLKNDEERYILKGLVEDDERAIVLFDNSLTDGASSEILAISKIDGKHKGAAIAKQPLAAYEEYAKKVADKAADEIIEGYIEAKPNESACQMCRYQAICNYEKTSGTRKSKKISSDIFSGEKDEE